MLIRDFPFIPLGGVPRPWLNIGIINPNTSPPMVYPTRGLIDTGADECCIPSYIASDLGHDIAKGVPKNIDGVGGNTNAFSHTTKIEIYDSSWKTIYTIDETCVDCVIGLSCVLLGVRQFLCKFIVRIDYPGKKFSIQFPKV